VRRLRSPALGAGGSLACPPEPWRRRVRIQSPRPLSRLFVSRRRTRALRELHAHYEFGIRKLRSEYPCPCACVGIFTGMPKRGVSPDQLAPRLLLRSSAQNSFLRRAQRFIVSVNTAHKTARAAHPIVKLRTYPFKMLASCLRFLDRDNPTNPFIAREWRQTLPDRQGFGIRAQGFS
jgi:hypothetical protein